MSKQKSNTVYKYWAIGSMIASVIWALRTIAITTGPVVMGHERAENSLFLPAFVIFISAAVGIVLSPRYWKTLAVLALLIDLPALGLGLYALVFSGYQF